VIFWSYRFSFLTERNGKPYVAMYVILFVPYGKNELPASCLNGLKEQSMCTPGLRLHATTSPAFSSRVIPFQKPQAQDHQNP